MPAVILFLLAHLSWKVCSPSLPRGAQKGSELRHHALICSTLTAVDKHSIMQLLTEHLMIFHSSSSPKYVS